MVTGIDVPSAGCWEIAAHYVPKTGKAETLTYILGRALKAFLLRPLRPLTG